MGKGLLSVTFRSKVKARPVSGMLTVPGSGRKGVAALGVQKGPLC